MKKFGESVEVIKASNEKCYDWNASSDCKNGEVQKTHQENCLRDREDFAEKEGCQRIHL